MCNGETSDSSGSSSRDAGLWKGVLGSVHLMGRRSAFICSFSSRLSARSQGAELCRWLVGAYGVKRVRA